MVRPITLDSDRVNCFFSDVQSIDARDSSILVFIHFVDPFSFKVTPAALEGDGGLLNVGFSASRQII